jgi:hypothetical protein
MPVLRRAEETPAACKKEPLPQSQSCWMEVLCCHLVADYAPLVRPALIDEMASALDH